MIVSTFSLIPPTQWRASWIWWRTRSSSLCRLVRTVRFMDVTACFSWMHLHPSSPAEVLRATQVRFPLKNPQESHVCQLEKHQFSFASKPFLRWVLSVSMSILQVSSILKSVVCTHPTHLPPLFSRISSVQRFYLNFQCFNYLWCALAPELICGRSISWWLGASSVLPVLSHGAGSRWLQFPNAYFPHPYMDNTVLLS